MKYCIAHLPCLLLALTVSGQSAFENLLDRYVSSKGNCQSFEYQVTLNSKSYSSDDTIRRTAFVRVARVPSDTIMGGVVSIELDTLWYGYDGKHIMRGNKNNDTLSIVKAAVHPRVFILSTWVDELVEKGLLKGYAGFKDQMMAMEPYLTISGTSVDGKGCKMLTFIFPDDAEIYNHKLKVAIDTVTMTVAKRIYSNYFQGNEQYKEWTFNNIRCAEGFTADDVTARASLFKTVTYFQLDTMQEDNVWEEFPFREVKGKQLKAEETIALQNVTAPVIVLDFWYSACYPCIKSIPIIERIANEYKDRGVRVYGINLIDDEVKQASRIAKFTRNNAMSYPTLMIAPEDRGVFPALAYPTMIVLNSDRQATFYETGFSENLYETLKAELEKLLHD